MSATDRLGEEIAFHDRQAHDRAADLRRSDDLRFDDDHYLDHETWIRPALGRLGDVAGRRVLDFGCGWGRTIRFFLKDLEPANLWGVDCYEDVLKLARQTNRWCRFQLIDPRPPLAFEPEAFDLIYCYSVFSHLAEDVHQQWLAEFHRILKPGGLLIATTRPRGFIETCDANLEKLPDWWVRHRVYADIPDMLARYDRGEYCYVATGGGGPLDKSFFGETCIPRPYVERVWGARFAVLDFVEDRSCCPQNVIVARK